MMFKYMSGTIPVAVEFGVVAIGPIANLVAFIIFVLFSSLFYQVPLPPSPPLLDLTTDHSAARRLSPR
jgi:hypothetical protein